MSKFLSELNVECIEDSANPKWRLLSPLIYVSNLADQMIVVPIGFITDFASTPRVPFFFAIAGNIATKASTIHDYLYTSQLFDREKSDNIFLEACDTSGVAQWRSRMMWLAIRMFGSNFWKEK